MNFRTTLIYITLFLIFTTIFVSQIQGSNSPNPVLWVWKFDIGNPYTINGNSIVDIDLLAMDTDMNVHDIEIKVVVTTLDEDIIGAEMLGVIGPGICPVTIFDNRPGNPSGQFKARITATCKTLGKTETTTINFNH